jgi:hypothetical protein
MHADKRRVGRSHDDRDALVLHQALNLLSENTAVGFNALFSNTSAENTAVGYIALLNVIVNADHGIAAVSGDTLHKN